MARRLRGARPLERLLYGLGLALLAVYGLAQLDAGVYEAVQSKRLEHLLEADRPAAGGYVAARTRAEARASGLVGQIAIERLGISAIVAEGTDGRTLRRSVGHLPDTAYPGEAGNVALAGHRDSFFRALRDVRAGDRVVVRTPDGTFAYTVDWTAVVEPHQVEIVRPTQRPALTLVTCYPFDYVGPAPRRFVVRATQVEPPPERWTRRALAAGG
jgi:sortase A